jgi:hypothetical protein
MRGTKPLAGAYQKVKARAKARSAAVTLAGQDIAAMPPSQATSLGKHTAAPSRRNPFFNGYASARLKRALYLFDVIVFSPVHGALSPAIAGV